MSGERVSWVREMCGLYEEVEVETVAALGEKRAGFFIQVANDWIDINRALEEAYRDEWCLVRHAAVGLWKEVTWFHFLFVTGHYPLLLSRLRFAWESLFRAYFAETYETIGVAHFPPAWAVVGREVRVVGDARTEA